VLDKLSHEPLAGARVWAESAVFDAAGDTPSALCDAQGKFQLAGLTELELPGADGNPRRSFDLHVEARDHAEPAAGSWSLEPAGAGRFRTTIELLPINCELHGVVNIAVDGAAAPISLVALIDEAGGYQVAPTQTGGFYKFERVAAGRALLWAWPAAQDAQTKGQPLFARGEIQLAPGSNTNVLWLEPIAGTQLSGHARALPGAEDLHPRVLLRRGIARGLEHVYYDERFVDLDAQGRFAVQDILPGHYQVELRFELAHGAALSEPERSETEIEVGQQSAPIELAYAHPLRLAGRVEGTPAELEGVLVDYQRSAGGLWTRATLRPDGSFDIAGLWPAPWKLRAHGKSGIGPEIEAGPQSALELRLRLRP